MVLEDRHDCGSARRGPFFCFARRHGLDVVVDDPTGIGGVSKIAGSAQRRTKTAILQHGSIMLGSRYPQQPVATWSGLTGRAIDFDQAVERLRSAFEKSLGVLFAMDSWDDAELDLSREIEIRYAESDWTVHHRRHR